MTTDAKPVDPWTPLPWVASSNAYGCHFVHGGPLKQWSTGVTYRDLVCGGNNHDTLNEANARYIVWAANNAPDLLEALEAVLAWDERRGWIIPYAVRDPIRAAIARARARGEQP